MMDSNGGLCASRDYSGYCEPYYSQNYDHLRNSTSKSDLNSVANYSHKTFSNLLKGSYYEKMSSDAYSTFSFPNPKELPPQRSSRHLNNNNNNNPISIDNTGSKTVERSEVFSENYTSESILGSTSIFAHKPSPYSSFSYKQPTIEPHCSSVRGILEEIENYSHKRQVPTTKKEVEKEAAGFEPKVGEINRGNRFSMDRKQISETWRLEDFDIGKKIGEGRFGKIYLAREKKTKCAVALKCISKDMILCSNLFHQLRREIELQHYAGKHHASITKLLAYFWDSERIVLVLEYAKHGNLRQYMSQKKQGCLTEQEASEVIRQLASALDFLHRHEIAHRDIKPENILISKIHPTKANSSLSRTESNTLVTKLTDFSWAVRLQSISAHCSAPPSKTTQPSVSFHSCHETSTPKKSAHYVRRHTLCGTVDYLSPEQVQSKGHTTKADMWALGVLSYELLCGSLPFESFSTAETYNLISRGSVSFPAHVSPEARAFISSLLSLNEDNRPSAEEALQHPFLSVPRKPIPYLAKVEPPKPFADFLVSQERLGGRSLEGRMESCWPTKVDGGDNHNENSEPSLPEGRVGNNSQLSLHRNSIFSQSRRSFTTAVSSLSNLSLSTNTTQTVPPTNYCANSKEFKSQIWGDSDRHKYPASTLEDKTRIGESTCTISSLSMLSEDRSNDLNGCAAHAFQASQMFSSFDRKNQAWHSTSRSGYEEGGWSSCGVSHTRPNGSFQCSTMETTALTRPNNTVSVLSTSNLTNAPNCSAIQPENKNPSNLQGGDSRSEMPAPWLCSPVNRIKNNSHTFATPVCVADDGSELQLVKDCVQRLCFDESVTPSASLTSYNRRATESVADARKTLSLEEQRTPRPIRHLPNNSHSPVSFQKVQPINFPSPSGNSTKENFKSNSHYETSQNSIDTLCLSSVHEESAMESFLLKQ